MPSHACRAPSEQRISAQSPHASALISPISTPISPPDLAQVKLLKAEMRTMEVAHVKAVEVIEKVQEEAEEVKEKLEVVEVKVVEMKEVRVIASDCL